MDTKPNLVDPRLDPSKIKISKTQPTPVLYAKNQDAVRCFGNQPKSCVDEENFFSTD